MYITIIRLVLYIIIYYNNNNKSHLLAHHRQVGNIIASTNNREKLSRAIHKATITTALLKAVDNTSTRDQELQARRGMACTS